MKRYFKLYQQFFAYSVMRTLMYRENFFIWSVVTVGWFILNIIFFDVVYNNVTHVAGWTRAQTLVVLGVYFIYDFVIWGFMFPNMLRFARKINTGELDLELAKPINTQFLISAKHVGFDDIWGFILGILVIVWAYTIEPWLLTWQNILLMIIALLVGTVFIYAGYFSTMCLAFWAERADNLHELFPGLRHLWRIPQPFYKGFMRVIVTFIIPATLVTVVPAGFLLGQKPWFYLCYLVLFATMALYLSTKILQLGLKRYSSASS